MHHLPAVADWRVSLRSQLRLVSKVIRHPERALLRLLLRARLARLNPQSDYLRFQTWLSQEFDVDAASLDAEYQQSTFRRMYRARLRELGRWPGSLRSGTSGVWSLKVLYLLMRAARPRRVVETGVLYGGSSAHILAALAENGEGELYSVDLPHDDAEPPPDFLVPEYLQNRWNLIIGDSRQALPGLLDRLGGIDCFHHDSLHTFEHMTWEYRTVLPYLRPRGVLSSHDVLITHSLREIFRPNAFVVFCTNQGLQWTTFQNYGLAVFGTAASD
jgi:predicted O-methyltransferase YrrM